MVAGRRSGLCAPFSAPRAPKNKLGQVQTPGPESRCYINRIARCARSPTSVWHSSRTGVRDPLRCPVNGAASRVSLLSVPSGFNSLQIRYVLIVFSFSPCP
jgi:hypothetical protein